MQIRPATPDDAWSIAAVDVASWQAAYRGLMPDAYLNTLSAPARAADWQRRLLGADAARGRCIFVADDEGAIAGFVRLGPDPDDPSAGFVFLLYVLPSRWGSGVGTALIAAAVAELRDVGFSAPSLSVLEANQRARRLYERLGWRTDGHRQFDTYGGRELPVLRYTLSFAPAPQGAYGDRP